MRAEQKFSTGFHSISSLVYMHTRGIFV